MQNVLKNIYKKGRKKYLDILDVYLCDKDVIKTLQAGSVCGIIVCVALGALGLYSFMLTCVYCYLPLAIHYGMALTYAEANYEFEHLPGIAKEFWIAGIVIAVIATFIYV